MFRALIFTTASIMPSDLLSLHSTSLHMQVASATFDTSFAEAKSIIVCKRWGHKRRMDVGLD